MTMYWIIVEKEKTDDGRTIKKELKWIIILKYLQT